MAMKRCPICGEKYSETYQDCPFCEEEEALRDGEEIRRRPRAGKRVAHGRQFSLITPILIVLIIIMAGLLIYLLYGDQLFGQKDRDDTDIPGTEDVTPPNQDETDPPDESTDPVPGPDDSQQPDDGQTGVMPEDPDDDPDETDTPPADVSDPEPVEPDENTNTAYEEAALLPGGLSLSKTDFTLRWVGETATITVSGGTGTYEWISQDDGVASVDQNGKVTAVSSGTINILATDGEKKALCIVRCNFTDGGGAGSSTTSSGDALKAGSARVVNGGNGVRVRSGPGTDYAILATVPNGASIQIVESAGDGWYRITFSDVGGVSTAGYMKGEFLANN